jgi:predicted O-linked N-acetylglucosamine transferase (SPINDLY family)
MDTIETAIEFFRQGKVGEAEGVCEHRLTVAPCDADTLLLLAEILMAEGRHDRAAIVLARLIEQRPCDAAARRRLGGALLALGRAAEAADALRAAIDIEPANGRAHNNLGQALLRLDRTAEAIASYEAALRLNPGYAIAHHNLGLAYVASGQPSLAVDCLRRAMALDPSLVSAELALTLTHQAAVLLSMESAAESLTAADAALQIDERLTHAHNVRAGALRRLGRRAEAVRALDRAVALDPQYAEAWVNQGTILHEMGRFEEALAACRRALELDPTGIQTRTRLLARLIPSVPASAKEATLARLAFDAQLSELQQWLARPLSERDALTVAQQQLFYLSYEEQSNRAVLQEYRGACAARLANFDGLSMRRAPVSWPGGRFKLGFVSAHVYDHSVFHALLRGWLQCLSRERFEVALFSLGTRKDACTEAAFASVEHVDTGAREIAEWARAIRDREVDALVYPEIGMNETTLALASLRLARRQFGAWGHPETSGLPTVDGYLSAELFEPPDAQDHYSERLIGLPNLGVYCQPYRIPPSAVDLEDFAVARDGPVLVCPGAPFKYRPQDDWILVEIARRLGRCTFVFFEHAIPELSRKLAARMAAAFADGGLDPQRYLRLIPWQPRAAFFGILRQADVCLDSIGFSGFNTLIQAMECHLPCITHEGRFLRGRLGRGIMMRLGLPQWIAHSALDYIDRAVMLAGEAGCRAEVRDAIRRAEHRLYCDSSAVDALSAQLLASREA